MAFRNNSAPVGFPTAPGGPVRIVIDSICALVRHATTSDRLNEHTTHGYRAFVHPLFLFRAEKRSNMLRSGGQIVDHLIRDARYGLRVLRQAPVFATVAILSLALGIGGNAAIFQLIDTVRFRSLPVPSPQGLAEVRADGVGGFGISNDFNAEVTYPLASCIPAWRAARLNPGIALRCD